MSSNRRPTRAQAIAAAGRDIAEAYLLLEELPVEEAARRTFTPTGPPLEDLEARIRARRAQRHVGARATGRATGPYAR